MAKPKGSEKTGGRKKGTPNKRPPYMDTLEATLELYIGQPAEDGATALQRDLAALEPKDRIYAAEKFLNYIKPKKQAVSADLNLTQEKPIEAVVRAMI